MISTHTLKLRLALQAMAYAFDSSLCLRIMQMSKCFDQNFYNVMHEEVEVGMTLLDKSCADLNCDAELLDMVSANIARSFLVKVPAYLDKLLGSTVRIIAQVLKLARIRSDSTRDLAIGEAG